MKEVKSPKKPLIYYYGIALLLVLLFNLVVAPFLTRAPSRKSITEHS